MDGENTSGTPNVLPAAAVVRIPLVTVGPTVVEIGVNAGPSPTAATVLCNTPLPDTVTARLGDGQRRRQGEGLRCFLHFFLVEFFSDGILIFFLLHQIFKKIFFTAQNFFTKC